MEPVVMIAHLQQLLLLQLPPSLMVLSQGTLLNLPILDMVNRLLLLHLRGMFFFLSKTNLVPVVGILNIIIVVLPNALY